MQVCNLSLGTTKRDFYAALHELADAAYFKNVILVTAANNVPQPSFPSMYASVISVACNDEQDPFRFYYNPTPPVEFGAPGIDVRGGLAGRRLRDDDGQQLRGAAHRRHRGADPGEAPGLTPFLVKTILRATAWNVRHAARRRMPPPRIPGD